MREMWAYFRGGEEMKKRCDKCYGTGKEYCEVHGSHVCEKCNGKGCIDVPYCDKYFMDPKGPLPFIERRPNYVRYG